ncbi:MAG TPA: aminoglycoside 3-N-acetyltransferase [Actinomycetota bacterium]|nr:aminoglycoside 3-N-acetyltransferase [Actinomycetota bacterium]
MSDPSRSRPPVTKRDLVVGLRGCGVVPGMTVMVHTSISSLGYVVGGADSVISALLEAVGPSGTIIMLVGWEHDAFDIDEWPERVRTAYLNDPPVFDHRRSEGARYVGRLPERARTWPGAVTSTHPEARFVAIGAGAEAITAEQPLHHPYGAGSPLAKLVDADGYVLLLGAPLETITLLHHAEELARVTPKKIVNYRAYVLDATGEHWVDIEDIDTSKGAFPYDDVVGDRDSFEVIAEEALESGIGRTGRIGEATTRLFPAKELLRFAVDWIERRFG